MNASAPTRTFSSDRLKVAVRPNADVATTKRARLIGLLKAAGGADTATLSAALGWQQHSTRAALTGLRKAGFTIERTTPDGAGAATYRITAEPKEVLAQ